MAVGFDKLMTILVGVGLKLAAKSEGRPITHRDCPAGQRPTFCPTKFTITVRSVFVVVSYQNTFAVAND